jgi:hypothetical protein
MSEPRLPAGVESFVRAVTRGSSDAERDRRASTFARGLAMGALVGAAIAGSTIWQRRQATGAPTAPPRLGDGSDRPPHGPNDRGGPAGGPTDG